MQKDKEKNPRYEAPEIKSYQADELDEELGFTLGSGDDDDTTPRFL